MSMLKTGRGKLGLVLLAPSTCNTWCYWRCSPVTLGVTGEHRRCAPAIFACNTRCYRRMVPVAPGITNGPIRGHEICCNQSEFLVRLADIAGAHRRCSPVTPGVTVKHRQCALAMFACNTGCYRRSFCDNLSIWK